MPGHTRVVICPALFPSGTPALPLHDSLISILQESSTRHHPRLHAHTRIQKLFIPPMEGKCYLLDSQQHRHKLGLQSEGECDRCSGRNRFPCQLTSQHLVLKMKMRNLKEINSQCEHWEYFFSLSLIKDKAREHCRSGGHLRELQPPVPHHAAVSRLTNSLHESCRSFQPKHVTLQCCTIPEILYRETAVLRSSDLKHVCFPVSLNGAKCFSALYKKIYWYMLTYKSFLKLQFQVTHR